MKVALRVDVDRMRRYRHSWLNGRTWLRELDPARKVEIIEAMGFVPTWDPHQADCVARSDSGLICICVPDPTMWRPPLDVQTYRRETWDDRLAAANARHERQTGR